MRRYLVVANKTLGGDHLLATLQALARQGPCSFHLLVPATPPSDHLWTEGEAQQIARKRLEQGLARFGALGLDVDGEIGDANPILAIGDVLRTAPFDEIVLSTLPPGLSRWLKLDLPHRVETAFGLPVTHVVSRRRSRAMKSA